MGLNLIEMSKKLGEHLKKRGKRLAIAESCTGGMLAQYITAVPESSQWFECGWVTYSNQSKNRLLQVPLSIIETYGAVSEETVKAMVQGVFMNSLSDIALAISGIAGPGGGTKDKPVGTIWLGFGLRNTQAEAVLFQFQGDRHEIREQAVAKAFEKILMFQKTD